MKTFDDFKKPISFSNKISQTERYYYGKFKVIANIKKFNVA